MTRAPRTLRSTDRAGFTFVELTFASAILSVACLGILSAVLFAHRAQDGAHQHAAALQACREVMEIYKALPFDNLKTFVLGAGATKNIYVTRFDCPAVPQLKNADPVGRPDLSPGIVTVTDVSGLPYGLGPAAGNRTLFEISVQLYYAGGNGCVPLSIGFTTRRAQ
ncbi:MAG: hypothetical protein HYZ53_00410 [Planctomycetes bacterium]|nr:hypothetical protein [Planctomycetota bacterium]